jgi:hypothetical protein
MRDGICGHTMDYAAQRQDLRTEWRHGGTRRGWPRFLFGAHFHPAHREGGDVLPQVGTSAKLLPNRAPATVDLHEGAKMRKPVARCPHEQLLFPPQRS